MNAKEFLFIRKTERWSYNQAEVVDVLQQYEVMRNKESDELRTDNGKLKNYIGILESQLHELLYLEKDKLICKVKRLEDECKDSIQRVSMLELELEATHNLMLDWRNKCLREDSKESNFYRAYINQPSRLDELHKYHGRRCIVDDKGSTVTVYFTEGDIHSMVIPRGCISRIMLSAAQD